MNKGEMKPGAIAPAGSMHDLFTGSWRTYVPVTDLDKCTHCMMCWVMCPDSSILVEDSRKVGTDLDHCKGCGICAAVCPVKAIEMKLESDMSPDERKG
ncbi:MAG: 4Fe-4S binding protein [Candidatus Brocadiaceae bacterium]|nr:4Fe-4S binding protein [Candidatus Brocadiaceae bacterium]